MQPKCNKDSSKSFFKTCCAIKPHTSPSAAAHRRNFTSAVLATIHPNTNFTDHESLPSSTELLSRLRNAIPDYFNTVVADSIRAQHYYHLKNHVCLDYVGHGLFSYSQKQESTPSPETASSSAPPIESPFFDVAYTSISFISHLLNGGGESKFSAAIKSRIMKYMNLLEEDYSLVFTANQSSAFKLLADSYPFHSHRNLLTVYDYENEAVQVMIDAAGKHGGRRHSAVFSWPSLRVNSNQLRKVIVNKNKRKNRGLFVFPLQSRITGSRYSYQWMNLARENGWHVLLDASALSAKEMEKLGLSLSRPDFLICSFFKIFGENPSGFCCLFVKKSSISSLNQSSSTIGIINLVPPNDRLKHSAINGAEKEIVELDQNLESNDAVEIDFRSLDHADILGLILISSRLSYLINWLANAFLTLRHLNGLPLIVIYGPRVREDRGPALAFNVYDWKGARVEPVLVQRLAARSNISISIGLLKNTRYCDTFEEGKEKMLKKKKKKKKREDCGVAVVSAALGMVTNFGDVYGIWVFVSRFLDADFVEKEKWRYTALNQRIVEV